MAKQNVCVVEGCGEKAHAKNYCRKHYGQIWRKGKIYDDEEEEMPKKTVSRDNKDRIRALERELRRAEQMYNNVVGIEGRLKWRREIDEVKKEMSRLGLIPEEEPVGAR